jgi:hypothetical protein
VWANIFKNLADLGSRNALTLRQIRRKNGES